MRKWPNALKLRAQRLREAGFSFYKISQELKVPTSTLNSWINPTSRLTFANKHQRGQWMKKVQVGGALGSHNRRLKILQEIETRVSQEIVLLDSNNLLIKKALLAALYWAEGSKSKTDGVIFANTDPYMIKLFATLLRNCYPIKESKLRLRIHIHYYHDRQKVKEFWSKLVDIPLEQFNKTQLKQRSKDKVFKSNLAGICFLKYNSRHLKEEILFFAKACAVQYIKPLKLPLHQDLRL